MAATTCVALAAISVAMSWAICCSTDMRESDSFDDMRTAGTAGCDRGCTRICGVDDRLVPATCSVGPLVRAGLAQRQFPISLHVRPSTGAAGRLAATLRMTREIGGAWWRDRVRQSAWITGGAE